MIDWAKGDDCMKKGFTLAEVLIVLGVIGIIAALTIPTLMSSYRQQVVTVRMQKFYSTFNQAIALSEIKNGPMQDWQFSSLNNPTEAVVFFEKYLKDYMKIISYKEYHDPRLPLSGVKVYFPDGSAAHFSGNYLEFFPVADREDIIGRDNFIFRFTYNLGTPDDNSGGIVPDGHGYGWSRETLMTGNQTACDQYEHQFGGRFCTELIMQNGWKIPDDYPIKF